MGAQRSRNLIQLEMFLRMMVDQVGFHSLINRDGLTQLIRISASLVLANSSTALTMHECSELALQSGILNSCFPRFSQMPHTHQLISMSKPRFSARGATVAYVLSSPFASASRGAAKILRKLYSDPLPKSCQSRKHSVSFEVNEVLSSVLTVGRNLALCFPISLKPFGGPRR